MRRPSPRLIYSNISGAQTKTLLLLIQLGMIQRFFAPKYLSDKHALEHALILRPVSEGLGGQDYRHSRYSSYTLSLWPRAIASPTAIAVARQSLISSKAVNPTALSPRLPTPSLIHTRMAMICPREPDGRPAISWYLLLTSVFAFRPFDSQSHTF